MDDKTYDPIAIVWVLFATACLVPILEQKSFIKNRLKSTQKRPLGSSFFQIRTWIVLDKAQVIEIVIDFLTVQYFSSY